MSYTYLEVRDFVKSKKHLHNLKSLMDKEDKIFYSNNITQQREHIMCSGLNNLTYTIINKIDIKDNIELIKVSI